MLRDLKSKFGTLILVKKPLKIKEKKIQLQIGRTYMEGWLMTIENFEKLKRDKKAKHEKKNNDVSHSQTQQNSDYGNNNDMVVEENIEGQSTNYNHLGNGKNL